MISLREKFEDRIIPEPNSGCWIWTGAMEKGGYGQLYYKGKRFKSHRISYELYVGPIPDGLEIDHLCRNKICSNPSHLEAVTHAENIRRGRSGAYNKEKTHCKHGHELIGKNLYIHTHRGYTRRRCNECGKLRMRKYRSRK